MEEPNAHLLLGPRCSTSIQCSDVVPRIVEQRCTACGRCTAACQFGALALMRRRVAVFQTLCIGCGALRLCVSRAGDPGEERTVGTIALGTVADRLEFAQGRVAVGEQRVTPVLQALRDVLAPDCIRILDAPPGTACPMQETIAGADYCLLVTEPTPFGSSDLAAAVETCRTLAVPCGVVVNRAGVATRASTTTASARGSVLLEIWQRAIAAAYARGGTILAVDRGGQHAARPLRADPQQQRWGAD